MWFFHHRPALNARPGSSILIGYRICREGCFVAHSQRYLIEARKPA